MKRVALVAAHFTPSNLAAVHRARLWAQHLPELGWEPVVVTTHHRHYEERLDWALHALVPETLRVLRTPALPTRPLRVVGDIGVRGLPFHYRALAELARTRQVDFIHITIPSNFSALLGRLIHERFGTPYGIDYIDPWVHEWPGSRKPLSKAWASARLGEALEPWAVRRAALITGVAPLYYEAVLARNPALVGKVVTAAMPYGASELDFEDVRRAPAPPFVFDPQDGNFHLFYAGAMLPRAFGVLARLLGGIARLQRERPDLGRRLRVHFVGTGTSTTDPEAYSILPIARQHGLDGVVHEHPARIGYVEVLAHLVQASAVLILGSDERHYTPSKAFQAIQSGRPVLALLHRESTAAELLGVTPGVELVTCDEHTPPDEAAITRALIALMTGDLGSVARSLPERFTAKASARTLADALDRALAASTGAA